jgi:hypothetical protein
VNSQPQGPNIQESACWGRWAAKAPTCMSAGATGLLPALACTAQDWSKMTCNSGR